MEHKTYSSRDRHLQLHSVTTIDTYPNIPAIRTIRIALCDVGVDIVH